MSQFGPDPPFPQTGGKYSGLVGGGLVTGGGGGVLNFLRKRVFVYNYALKERFATSITLGVVVEVVVSLESSIQGC